MKCLIIIAVLVVGTSYALPEPPVQQQGWAQAAPPVQQAPVAQGVNFMEIFLRIFENYRILQNLI